MNVSYLLNDSKKLCSILKVILEVYELLSPPFSEMNSDDIARKGSVEKTGKWCN